MRRDQWKFEYSAGKLVEAAAAKRQCHTERLECWKAKREQAKNLAN